MKTVKKALAWYAASCNFWMYLQHDYWTICLATARTAASSNPSFFAFYQKIPPFEGLPLVLQADCL